MKNKKNSLLNGKQKANDPNLRSVNVTEEVAGTEDVNNDSSTGSTPPTQEQNPPVSGGEVTTPPSEGQPTEPSTPDQGDSSKPGEVTPPEQGGQDQQPSQPSQGEPGTGKDDNDNSTVGTLSILPHTPLEMSVGTPIILQITREDKTPLTGVNIAASTGTITVSQDHEDKTLYSIKVTKALKGDIIISAQGFMSVTLPIEFLAVNFTVTPSKTVVREKEKFTLTVAGVRDTDVIVPTANIQGFEYKVVSNQLVEVTYNKNDIEQGQTKEADINLTVNDVKVVTKVTIKPQIDILTLTYTPGNTAYFNEEITLAITGTTEQLTLTVDNNKITMTKVDDYNYKFSVKDPAYGKVTISGPNVQEVSTNLTFRDKKRLEVLPHTPLSVSVEQPIILEVISKTGEDIPNIILKSRNGLVTAKRIQKEGHGNLYEIKPLDQTKNVSDILDISSSTDRDVVGVEQEVNFTMVNVTIVENQQFFRARKLNTLTLEGLKDTDEVTVEVDNTDVVIKRSSFGIYEVVLNKDLGKSETVKADITFIINGNKVGHTVTFYPEVDTISFNLFPGKDVKYTSEVTVQVEGAKSVVNLRTSNPAINIRRIGELSDNKFIVDSTMVTEAIITATGIDVEAKSFTINFKENEGVAPMEIEKPEVVVSSDAGTFDIIIKNVYSNDLKAKSPSFKIKPLEIFYRRDFSAVAHFQLSEVIEEPVNTTINFYRNGKIVMTVPVRIELPKPKEPFACDKLTLQGYVTSAEKPNGIVIGLPFLGKEKDFVCRGATEEFNSQIVLAQSANRLTITAAKPCKGRVILTHPAYLDSYVDVEFVNYNPNFGPVIVENKDELIREAEGLGLEYKNDMTVPYDPDEFILNVISNRVITDKEKLGYMFVNGSTENKTVIRFFTSYEKNNTPNGTFLGPDAVARDNFNLYNIIKKVIYTHDYYMFREEFLMIIQAFKTYKDTAFNLLRVYRFEEKWKGSPQDLDKFKLITTFISKYVEQQGKGMNQYVKPLRAILPLYIVDNLDKFTNEEIFV